MFTSFGLVGSRILSGKGRNTKKLDYKGSTIHFFEEGGGEITGIDGYPYLKHLIEFLDRGLGGAAGKD